MNFLAKFDLDALIPLIIGAVWVVAQLASAAAKKKAPPRAAPDSTGSTDEDPFADLMRKLSGVQEIKIPTPPKPKPKPVVNAVPPPRSAQNDAVRTPHLRPKPPEPVTVPKVDIRPSMESFKTVMPSMKLPSMKLSFQTSEKSGSGVPKVGKIIGQSDKQALRRAVLGHIILGKPKAMEGWSTGTVE